MLNVMKKHFDKFAVGIALLIILSSLSATVFAAGGSVYDITTVTGNTAFDRQITDFNVGFRDIARSITSIMIVVAGIMVAFGIQDGRKTVWQFLFGLSAAWFFGDLMWSLFGENANFLFTESDNYKIGNVTSSDDLTKMQDVEWTETAKDKNAKINNVNATNEVKFNFLGDFMQYYHDMVILPGMQKIIPVAIKLTLIFATINGGVKLALDLINGDKIKFLLMTILKVGFYLYLIMNWVPLSDALAQGFEQMGYLAGSYDGDEKTGKLNCNSIIQNAFVMAGAFWASFDFGVSTIVPSLFLLIAMVAVIICAFLIALEMFMVRIEMYTMALLAIPLLAFGVLDPLKSFAEKAWAGIFNLSIKLMVIAFIESFAVKLFTKTAENIVNNEMVEDNIINLVIALQIILIAVVIAYITKKIPGLVQSLLSGQPALTGSDMKQLMAKTAETAGNVAGKVGMVVGAMQAASAVAAGNGGGKMSALKNLAKAGGMAAATKNPVTQGWQKGIQSMLGENGLMRNNAQAQSPQAQAQRSGAWNLNNEGGASAKDLLNNARYGTTPKDAEEKRNSTAKKGKTHSSTEDTQVNNSMKTDNNISDKQAAKGAKNDSSTTDTQIDLSKEEQPKDK